MDKHEFYRDINNYVLINNDYYRREWTNPHRLNPVPVSSTHLKGRFGFTARQLEEVIELTGWINEPQHLDYSSIVDDKWNTYYRVDWTPKEGEWPTIRKLLNHAYGKNSVEEDQLDAIFDYHTILLKWPKQKLFARVLYSHVQGTAKSTLAELEHMMFGGNYAKVRDNEFEDRFNSLWTNALIIHMDEPQFKDSKAMSRWIRDLVTAKTVNVRKMKQEYEQVEFHGKFLITSNDSDFMPFEYSDRRYWIREMPKFPEEDLDPHFNKKMEYEVPYYVHFLLNREMKWPEPQGVFWLPQSVLKTRGAKTLMGDNVVSEHQQLLDWFENYFLSDRQRTHVTFNLRDLVDLIDWEAKKPSTREIAKILRDQIGLRQPDKARRLKNGENYILRSSDAVYGPGKFWTARVTDFDINVDIFGEIGI